MNKPRKVSDDELRNDRPNDIVIICEECRHSYPGERDAITGALSFKHLKEDGEQIKGKVHWIDKCFTCIRKEHEDVVKEASEKELLSTSNENIEEETMQEV
jgi:hypothetical protein